MRLIFLYETGWQSQFVFSVNERIAESNHTIFHNPKILDINNIDSPFKIAINNKTNLIYVANENGSLYTIDGRNDKIINHTTFHNQIYDFNINSNTNDTVLFFHNGTISILDGNLHVKKDSYKTTIKHNGVRSVIPSIETNPENNIIYLIQRWNKNNSTITPLIDSITNKINLHLSIDPRHTAINPKTNKLYLLDTDHEKIYALDPENKNYNKTLSLSNESSYNPETQIDDYAINTESNVIYWINRRRNRIFALNGSSGNFIMSFIINNKYELYSSFSSHIAVDSSKNIVYFTDDLTNTVSVINGSTGLMSKIKVGKSPYDIAINPTTNKIYVANHDSNSISVIDGNYAVKQTNLYPSQIESMKVGKSPYDIAINPTTNKIYVANHDSNSISVIDASNYNDIKTIDLSYAPGEIVINPKTNLVYVSTDPSDPGNVTIINGTGNDQIITHFNSSGVRVDSMGILPDHNKIFFSSSGSLIEKDLNMRNIISNESTILIPENNDTFSIDFEKIKPVENKYIPKRNIYDRFGWKSLRNKLL